MRLFLALDLDDAVRDKVVNFMDSVRSFAPDARWARPESLHVTLKFIGNWPDERLLEMQQILQTIRAEAFDFGLAGYGFFPHAKSPRVFWIGIQAPSQLASLAATVDEATGSLGVVREDHRFNPHLTLARRAEASASPRRTGSDHPNSSFANLQEKLVSHEPLDFGTLTARSFFLYQSESSPEGSRYSKLSRFPLRVQA